MKEKIVIIIVIFVPVFGPMIVNKKQTFTASDDLPHQYFDGGPGVQTAIHVSGSYAGGLFENAWRG